jgi:hypothetical protein
LLSIARLSIALIATPIKVTSLTSSGEVIGVKVDVIIVLAPQEYKNKGHNIDSART